TPSPARRRASAPWPESTLPPNGIRGRRGDRDRDDSGRPTDASRSRSPARSRYGTHVRPVRYRSGLGATRLRRSVVRPTPNAGVHVAAPQRDDAEAERRDDEVERMRGALGDDHGLVGTPASLGKLAQLDTAPDQPGAGEHRWEARLPEALSRALAGQLVDVRAEDVDAQAILAERVVGLAEPEVRRHAQREIAESFGDRAGLPARCDRLIVVAHPGEELTHVGGELAEAALVTQ